MELDAAGQVMRIEVLRRAAPSYFVTVFERRSAIAAVWPVMPVIGPLFSHQLNATYPERVRVVNLLTEAVQSRSGMSSIEARPAGEFRRLIGAQKRSCVMRANS